MKIVLQDGNKDCGICSLLSIIRFYGGDVSKEYLRELTNTTKNGVSAFNLIEGARKLGFIAEGMNGDMTKINENNLPCLAHLAVNKNYKHFVVIYKIDRNSEKVIIMDPAKGKKILSFSEFRLMSTNNFIFLKPLKQLPFFVNKRIIRKIIRGCFLNNKKLLFMLVLLVLSHFIFNVMLAFNFKYFLNFVIEYAVSTNILVICFSVFVVSVFKVVSEFLKSNLFIKIGSVIDEVVTLKTFKQILLLPYLYYKNRTTGEVVTRLKDLNNIKNFLFQLFNILITDAIGFIIFLILMFKINKDITLIVLCLIVGLSIFVLLRNIVGRKIYFNVCNSEEKVNSYLIESLNNVDTIKGGHIEKRLSDRFLFLYKNLLEKNYLYSFFLQVNRFVKDSIKSILLIVVYGVGSLFVVRGKITIGDIILYQSFLMCFLENVIRIINLLDEYHNYKISLHRIEDLYTITNEKFEGSYYYYNYVLDGDICFNNLIYKYGSKKIFNNLNLFIKKGERILLTGESGSGKSSLMKILMRYLEIPYGMCSISNIDINHYHLENIRANVSYVSCNEFLFTDSLYNNITLNKDVVEEDFFKVCHIAEVDEIITKRDCNYQMLVEENGFNFSNGERQRIVLARYLLRNSNIYIFDEAFGQIDITREKKILQDMFEYLKNKTIIVISHRFNNKSMFDRIIKLDKGCIVEEKI